MRAHGRCLLALALLCSGIIHATERADVPEKYQWNLNDIFPSDAAWETARAAAAARVLEFEPLQGKLAESPETLYQVVFTLMDQREQIDKVSAYASMRADEDTRVEQTRAMLQTAQGVPVLWAAASAFIQPEIIALGEAKVREYIAADPRLKPYAPWLEDILRYKAHTLSPAEEKIMALTSDVSQYYAVIQRIFTNADFPYPTITLSSGNEIRLDPQAYTLYRASENRTDREAVFKAFFTSLQGYERTLGTILTAHVMAHRFDMKARHFDSCLEDALFDANIPESVYRNLIANVHASLPTLHRYLALRQRMLGVERLEYEDLYTPMVKGLDNTYTPEEAANLVIEAAAPLGSEYTADLGKCFTQRWVDFMPSTGKKSGAYSNGVYGVHPYQLCNFMGRYDDVSTLAHECGHSMHTYLSCTHQPYVTHDYKTFVAEVASTLDENLLLHYMLDHNTDKATRLFLLGQYLDGMRATLFRQTLFAEFELRIHETVENDEPLTGESMTRLYLALLKEYYGADAGVCAVDDLYGVEWAYIPHFYYNFYVYQYSTSIMASSAIAARIREEAAAMPPSTQTRDAYLAMLSSGSSKYPIELLDGVGVDMTTAAPCEAAMKEMNAAMDEIERLLATAEETK